jgi:hypothetical protein
MLLVVILAPAHDLSPCITQAREPVRIQAFVAQSSGEAFCVRVLRRLTGPNEFRPHSAFFAPRGQRSPAKLWPIVQNSCAGIPSAAMRSGAGYFAEGGGRKARSINVHRY